MIRLFNYENLECGGSCGGCNECKGPQYFNISSVNTATADVVNLGETVEYEGKNKIKHSIGANKVITEIDTAGATAGQVLSFDGTNVNRSDNTAGSEVWVEEGDATLVVSGSTITLSQTPIDTKRLRLSRNGMRIQPTQDFTISGNTISLLIPSFASDQWYVNYRVS